MASTQIQIWNMALSHIGVKAFVASPTERSQEASVLNVWWQPAIDYVLADHNWAFARKYATLNLVEEDPNPDWQYAYRYPSDCIHARRICSPKGRRDPLPPPFVTGQDDDGKLVLTDQEDAVLEYTVRVTEPERFDEKFTECLTFYLASRIALPLSRIPNMMEKMEAMYENKLIGASTKAMNEMQQDEQQEAEWIQARG